MAHPPSDLSLAEPPSGMSAAAGEPLVVLSGVQKYFGDLHVLRDIDLTVHRGEAVVVIGPSGSGQPTLCRPINRSEPLNSRSITLDGQEPPAEGRAFAGPRTDVGVV